MTRRGLLGRIAGIVVFGSGCAQSVQQARSLDDAGEGAPTPLLRRGHGGRPALPDEGVLFGLEGPDTSTVGLASDPLEAPWLAAREPVPPILAQTGTISFDLPISSHPLVGKWVSTLGGSGRRWFEIWLARSTRFVPLFYEVLDRHRLPRDLVFLAMVESGFSPRAYSWASAAGPWQFIPGTARRYGLRVSFWVDERRDFEKSTEAAAQHLEWLHRLFDDWHLAMAAYNAGSGKVRGALRRGRARDYWALQGRRRLARETEHYVPKIIASAMISKQPSRYGFKDVPYQPPIAFETVTVTVATSLATMGEACGGLPKEALEELNPALRVSVTPPGETWLVRVPPGMAETCADGLSGIPPETRTTFRYHEPREGETLESIAERYQTTVDAILRFHGHDDPSLMMGYAEMAIPVPHLVATRLPIVTPVDERPRGGSYAPAGPKLVRHTFRRGDTLVKIARRFGVSVQQIREWNGLGPGAKARVGQTIKIFQPLPRRWARPSAGVAVVEAGSPGRASKKVVDRSGADRAAARRHRVRRGDSLWRIARRYDTTVERLRALNRLLPGQSLAVGQMIDVR